MVEVAMGNQLRSAGEASQQAKPRNARRSALTPGVFTGGYVPLRGVGALELGRPGVEIDGSAENRDGFFLAEGAIGSLEVAVVVDALEMGCADGDDAGVELDLILGSERVSAGEVDVVDPVRPGI